MVIRAAGVSTIALCAGAGGLELGVKIAVEGAGVVCYVERNGHSSSTIVARMEDSALDRAPIWDDVTTFDGSPWRRKIHILTGGYPCQPFSQSGHRLGENDPRHLWPHIRRIIGEVEPRVCFFENVYGHASLGIDEVLSDLRSIGYQVEAGVFSSFEVGSSNERKRVFIMAHADGVGFVLRPYEGHAMDETRRPTRPTTPLEAGGSLVYLGPETNAPDPDLGPERQLWPPSPDDVDRWRNTLRAAPHLEPTVRGVADGVALQMDRIRLAGNGVCPLAAAYAFSTLSARFLTDSEWLEQVYG